jgi:hypothetical protein
VKGTLANGIRAKLHTAMPCRVTEEIDIIIACDRKMIQTYIVICLFVLALACGTFVYFHFNKIVGDLESKLIEALVTSVAIPIVFLYLKRKNALTPCMVMRVRAQQYGLDDPACAELKDWVNQELKRRNGES